jgi:hypothetical protein
MFDLKSLELSPEILASVKPVKKLRKKRETFIRTPFSWWEKLSGYQGQTLAVALYIIHARWILMALVAGLNGGHWRNWNAWA